MLYEKNNNIYIKQDNKYYLAIIIPKHTTISIMPSNEYEDTLEGAKEITFKEVKARRGK